MLPKPIHGDIENTPPPPFCLTKLACDHSSIITFVWHFKSVPL